MPTSGNAYELAFLGNLSYENVVANPYQQVKTIVAATDDTGGGQVYLYVGDKKATGTEVDKAGLTGGELYGIKVTGLPVESSASPANGTFSLARIGDTAPGGVSEHDRRPDRCREHRRRRYRFRPSRRPGLGPGKSQCRLFRHHQ